MNITMYKNYSDIISNSLKYGQRRGATTHTKVKNFSNVGNLSDDIQNNSFSVRASLNDTNKDKLLFESLQPLSLITGRKGNYHLKPGAHPDFTHIVGEAVENHYITSMFIDIKNSTNLFRKYIPLVVANITTTIQRAAIHTCWYFDGYIQRFHGDGLMVYFGGKNTSISKSTENAINAASYFSYFMENDLKNIFLEQGVEKIFTRIGIDTGIDEDVIWYQAGMGECSEVATSSLHTSLAAKMQNNAPNNGIMVGDNVKSNSSFNPDLYNIISEPDRYIFRIPDEQFNYTQWNFNWQALLKNKAAIFENKKDSNNSHTANNPSIVSNPIIATSANIEYLRSQTKGYRPYYNE